ncbi:RNA-binding S4 domain-containing protein [Mycoplasma enhydrae]|uniref:RNA-binding S4 domain-containing protein n=1 Tax=Mycoplasma enhydrae TaxID=2499220 RepID=UPI00197B5055|nr:RNA-binding S4 domain-containing protein [Mycoplasma enhydrae]MBN4089330.1 RNA-binding S4 domain-containing protein [Mycoplasma enhydrae]MCV3733702.1 RNA-binding S4 domain-containing protein [Mycoplasma enhydrae]MCV3753641.1 RNA-binding S4 domain-containing protein [Mycoplasma enhydrae]
MKVEIKGNEIKLAQFLKKAGICRTGGMAKFFLSVHKIKINDRVPEGRNAKIRVGDTVWIDDELYIIKAAEE